MENEMITKTATSLELERIANALEEIIRLVKEDQEKFTARESRERLQKND
jgi:hypothetical protein